MAVALRVKSTSGRVMWCERSCGTRVKEQESKHWRRVIDSDANCQCQSAISISYSSSMSLVVLVIWTIIHSLCFADLHSVSCGEGTVLFVTSGASACFISSSTLSYAEEEGILISECKKI